jgi:LysM repeat protein
MLGAVIIGLVGLVLLLPSAQAAPLLQEGGIYVVQRGDTLTGLAARFGLAPDALAHANGLRNLNFIWVGQRLIIPAASSYPPAQPTTHIVQRGETLTWIAARYGITPEALARANGLRNLNFIWVGQRLEIPGATPTAQPTAPALTVTPSPVPSSTPTPAPTGAPSPVPSPTPTSAPPTATAVPRPTAVPPTATPQPTQTSGPTPRPTAAGPTATPPLAEAGIHIVQPGETLAKIASQYGTTVAALSAANNLDNPNLIWVGQRLRVNAGGAPLPEPTARPAPTGGRWIDINLSWQRLTAYEGNTPVFSTAISGGLPGTPTVVGTFAIQTKLVAQTMSGPGYWLPNVPYVMYFYAAYAIHGAYWHNNFGHPMSHGCVNVSVPDSAWLFSWASVGTPVISHW